MYYRGYTYPDKVVIAYEHPYANCPNCNGTGVVNSRMSSGRYACSTCSDRYEERIKLFGEIKAQAEQSVLRIEHELATDWETPKECKRAYTKHPKQLSNEAQAFVQVYITSEQNREYLHNLKVWWE